jgi:hypothetical protein
MKFHKSGIYENKKLGRPKIRKCEASENHKNAYKQTIVNNTKNSLFSKSKPITNLFKKFTNSLFPKLKPIENTCKKITLLLASAKSDLLSI